MADPSTYRPEAGSIPDAPGVYRFRDAEGRVVYVGKAISLRSRLSNYFADLSTLHVRTQAMVTTAASVDWVTVNNEVEALQLEYSWIKEYDPRFNVRYRDDKSYPYLAVTMGEEYPRITVMRGAKRSGTRYFGPFAHAWAIRETVDQLLRVFPVRTCSGGVFRRHKQLGRPCLLGDIGRCSAPCVGRVTADEHRNIALDFCAFMAGQTNRFVKNVEKEMLEASEALDFERAARRRDDLHALNRALERNAIVLGDDTDTDVIALAEDPLEAAVQVFHVRGGRVRGQRGFVVELVEDVDSATLVERLIQQLYGAAEADSIPREVLVPVLPSNHKELAEWLSTVRGTRVEVRVPQRGDKRALMDTVRRNAEQSLALHKIRRAGDLTSRGQALEEIQEALGLPDAPLRIECIDVSTMQGEDVVASLVVFEDGVPRKSDYRRFIIRGQDGQDDVRAVAETVTRRFSRQRDDEAAQEAAIESGAPKRARFAYRPQLLVVDGGAPQVASARQALLDVGLDDLAVVGLAKRLEEVWLPGDPDPIILPRTSEGLYLLQRVRDEAHRFAISHLRKRRAQRSIASVLDDVPGLGEVRRKAVLAHFGSVKKLRAATLAEVAEVPGIGPATAAAIVAAVAVPTEPAVNVTTGEIIDDSVGSAAEGVHT
jgi:excinuclease ABC subunit C